MRAFLVLVLLVLGMPEAGRAQSLPLPVLEHHTPAPTAITTISRLLVKLPAHDAPASLTAVRQLLNSAGLRFAENLPRIDWSMWIAQIPLDRTTLAALQQAVSTLLPTARIQPNYRYHRVATPTDPDYSLQWALNNYGQRLGYAADAADGEDPASPEDRSTSGMDIGIEGAWDRQPHAQGVVVAILDSGVAADTPDLAGATLVAGYDFCENDNNPDDDVGHGTAIAGLIAATHNNAQGIAGAAPGASLMPLRFIGNRFPSDTACTGAQPPATCDCNFTSAAIKAIDYAIDHGAHIINMSFGGSEQDTALEESMQAAVEAGLLLVAAAGNEGQNLDDIPSYPASFEIPGMLAVASHTNDGNISSFSNYGSAIHLAAPGSTIWLPNPNARDRFNHNNFDDLPPSQGLIDDTYRATMPVHSDFSLSSNGRWGIAELVVGGNVAVLDIDRAYNGEAGYSPAAGGTWTSTSIAVTNTTQIRAEIFAELAGTDFAILEASTNDVNWVPVVRIDGEFSAPIEVPMSEIFAGDTSHVRIRIRTEITDGSETGLSGGMYIGHLRLWERSTAAEAELDDFSFTQGTSFAAPYVSAVAALVRAQSPSLSPRAIAARIMASAGTLPDTGGQIPSNRRLDAAAALDPKPRLFVPGTDRFRQYPYFPASPKSGENVEFRVSYIDPDDRPVPEFITLLLAAPAHDFTDSLSLAQVVTRPSDHYYEYAAKYVFAQDDTWQYDTSVTLQDSTFVQGPAGEIEVDVGRNLAFPSDSDSAQSDAGCGCTVVRANQLGLCPLATSPTWGMLTALGLWIVGWLSLRNRPNESDRRA